MKRDVSSWKAQIYPDALDDVTFEPTDLGVLEIDIQPTGKVVHIHAEGRTILRVCRIKEITLRDFRKGEK